MVDNGDGYGLNINARFLDRKNKQKIADAAAIKQLIKPLAEPEEYQLELAEVIISDQFNDKLRKKSN